MIKKTKQKVLVLGGTSYLGNGLIQFLSKNQNLNILSYSREFSNYLLSINIPQINGKILDRDVVKKIQKYNPEILINLISLDHSKSELDIYNTIDSNINPFWNICAEGVPTDLKCVIYFSTIQVYNQNLKGDINETSEVNPINIYGLTHKISEDINKYYGNKFGFLYYNLRISNSFGHCVISNKINKCWDYVINDLMYQAYNKNFISLKSDGTPERDFIPAQNIFKIVEELLIKQSAPSGLYNVCSSKNHSIIFVANLIKKTFLDYQGKKLEILINESQKISQSKLNELISLKPNSSIISNEKLKKHINNVNPLDMKKNIVDFLNHLKSHE